jgi:hypothetical protein
MDNWSEKVRALEAAGWTLTEIARHTGMSLPGVSDVKQRRTKNPGGMPAVRLHALYERESALPKVTTSPTGGVVAPDEDERTV